jgi:T5SS/PEP-CTERM-associated repeat protein
MSITPVHPNRKPTLIDLGEITVDNIVNNGTSGIFEDESPAETLNSGGTFPTISWTNGGTDNLFQDADNWFPGTVPGALDAVVTNGLTIVVDDTRNIGSLGLGTFDVTGAPLPIINVDGGTLGVVENIVSTSTGVYPAPTGSQPVTGGGTIDIGNHGALEVGGTADSGITVDFTDASGNTLHLDSASGTSPNAFAGTILGFTQGNTIVFGVSADGVDSASYDATSGVLSVTRNDTTVATLKVPETAPLVSGNFVLGDTGGALSVTEAPIFSYGWDISTAQVGDSWRTAADWVQLPVTGSQTTRTVPLAADNAFIVGGILVDGVPISAPVNIAISDIETISTLGLGTYLSPGAPLPTLNIDGGSLEVTGAILGSFGGAFVSGLPSESFAGGGTIDLNNGGTLDVDGAADAAIVVDFTDAAANELLLDAVNSGAPNAFAGTIDGFAQGDTITLGRVRADASDAVNYDPATNLLTLTEDGLTVATLKVDGSFSKFNFAATGSVSATGDNVTNITEGPPAAAGLTVVGATGFSGNGVSYGVSGGPGGAAVGYNRGNGIDQHFTTVVMGGTGGGGAAGAGNASGVGGPAGAGGAGGYASANTNPGPMATSYLTSDATATGGNGGPAGGRGIGTAGPGAGASPGAGARGAATATAVNTEGTASANAIATGGSGGSVYAPGFTGGAGAAAYIGTITGAGAAIPGTVFASGTSARATATLMGGSGGAGLIGANGGAGASATLVNAVQAAATTGGSIYLRQTATGGAGGTSYGGHAGAAGDGASTLIFTDSSPTPAASLAGDSAATGGNGGPGGYATNPSDGGKGATLLSLTGSYAVTANGYALGGFGGSSGDNGRGALSTGNGGNGGAASVLVGASSTSHGPDSTVARATAVGGNAGGGPFANSDEGVAYFGVGNGGAGGAVNGASAISRDPGGAAGSTSEAYTVLVGGFGGPASGEGKFGGAGGAVSGAYAEASGFAALASVVQRGGSGGSGYVRVDDAPPADGFGGEGASGGAGADSSLDTDTATHTYAVKATATGGAATSRQVAYGGNGGMGANGISGGAAGTAYSNLIVDNSVANGLYGESGAFGGAGGRGHYTTSGATGGAATAVFIEAGAHRVGISNHYETTYGAVAVGGSGGVSTGTGSGGTGGTAYSKSLATSTTTVVAEGVQSNATSTGGAGGYDHGPTVNGIGGASGGAGGESTYTNAEAFGSRAYSAATARGGAGGDGTGVGHSGGAGGEATGTFSKAESDVEGAVANAYATQTGGNGGNGTIGAAGGDGADSKLVNAVIGSTVDSRLTLRQTATGGAGGYGRASAGGGTGGNASSYLTFNDIDESSTLSQSIYAASQAVGGAGGGDNSASSAAGGAGIAFADVTGATNVNPTATATGGGSGYGPNPGVGGNAIATAIGIATSTGATGVATVAASATGGAGASLGNATADASAATTSGQQATAAATANGAVDLTRTRAATNGTGVVTEAVANTSATGTGQMVATSDADIGGNLPSFQGSGLNDYAEATGLPIPGFDFVPALLGVNQTIAASFGSDATFLGYSTQGLFSQAATNGFESLTSTTTYTIDATTLSGYLIAGLVSDDTSVSLDGGFTSLTFTATVNGVTIGTPDVFTSMNVAQAFFDDDALNLGGFTATPNLIVSLSLTLVTSTPGEGFGASFLLGVTNDNGPPVISAPSVAVVERSHERAIPGVSLSETAAVAGETFTVTLSDTNGLLIAGNGNGATVTGAGTTNLSISGSLAQVNAVLGTLFDSDAKTPSDSITLNATDNLGGIAAAETIAVVVNGPPVIVAPTSVTVDQNIVATIAGVSLTESGDTSGETFSVTVSGTHGEFAATNFAGGATLSGNGTNALTVSGSLTQVNAALNTLSEADATLGSDPIVLHANDSFGGSADAGGIAVTIRGALVVTAPRSATVDQGESAPILGVSVSQVGDTGQTDSVTVQDEYGLLSITSPGGAVTTAHSLTISGSLAAVNARLATLTDTESAPGLDSIVLTAADSIGASAPVNASIAVAVNAEFPPVILGAGSTPKVATLTSPGGLFVATWQASSNGAAANGVLVGLFNSNGQPAGATFEPSQTGVDPSVAAGSNGQFLISWLNNTTGTIQGAIYNADGSVAKSAFDMTTAPVNQFVTSPSVSAEPGGYLLTYDITDPLNKSASAFYQAFNAAGDKVGAATAYPDVALNELGVAVPITDLSSPQPVFSILGGLQAQLNSVETLFGPIIGLADDSTADLLSGKEGIAVLLSSVFGGASGSSSSQTNSSSQQIGSVVTHSGGQQIVSISHSQPISTVLLTPIGDGVVRVSPDIAQLSNGDYVGIWEQLAPADTTWTLAGQIVDPAGQFVGGEFTIATTLAAAATPEAPVVNALANGDFVVIYNAGAGTLAGQEFDSSGNELGGSFGVSDTSQGGVATTVLSDGTLLTLSGDSSGEVASQTFTVQAPDATWSGTTGTDLGTAGNWQPVAIPGVTETLIFGTASGGSLTGGVSGLNAVFSGPDAWLLQNSTLTLTGEAVPPTGALALTDEGNLTVAAGSITAGGSIDIESASGAVLTAEDGASLNAQGLSLGIGNGESGALDATGAGTVIQNTGVNGLAQIGGAGSGQVTVSGGASVTNATGATLGADSGGTGSLTVTGAGSQFVATGELLVGVAGAGHVRVENAGTIISGDSPAFPSQGVDISSAPGGAGDVAVTGSHSMLTNTGKFVVGDAALGSLSILSGGTVDTSPGTSGLAGLVIANTASASGSSVNVSGAGSQFNVTGALTVGGAGFGSLSLSQGATVTGTTLTEGAATGGSGVVTVAGTGTGLNLSGVLNVGGLAPGELSILNGAEVSAASVTLGAGAGGAGNIVIGAASTLTVTGSVTVGVSAAAVLNIQGGTLVLSGSPSFGANGRLVQVGGKIDPAPTLIVSGNAFGGGAIDEASIEVLNTATTLSKAPDISGGSATFLAPLVTGGSASKPGIWNIDSGGTLVLDVNSVVATQEFSFADNTGVLEIGQQVTLDGSQTPQPIDAAALGGFLGSIDSYQTGDQIVVDTTAAAGFGYVPGGTTITVNDLVAGLPVGAQEGALVFTDAGAAAQAFTDEANGSLGDQLACFVAGTRIGGVVVEDLRVGDTVPLAEGGRAPVVWIGSRTVECGRHARPESVWPVRVEAGAFGENLPVRDLYLSPDHAVFVNDVLVPVRLLVNGTTIARVKRRMVTYYHVELAEHAVILAEGLPCESYLDVGDRADFDGGETIRLHPDFGARLAPDTAMVWETKGAAPLVMAGPELAAARRAVADRGKVRLVA